jgi:hypothetical protein
VVEEVGIDRFDVVLFVLLPSTLMGTPVMCAAAPSLPGYLRERGRASSAFQIMVRFLSYIEIPEAQLPSEAIEVPVQIIACEALK